MGLSGKVCMKFSVRITALLILTFFIIGIGCSKKSSDPAPSDPVPSVPAPTAPVIQLISNSTISAAGNDNRTDYPISNTLDGNLATFMTTNTLSNGTVVYVAYEFASAIKLSRIEIVDNYTNNYNMGDLDVQVSQDSTDGINGTWVTVTSITAASTNFVSGDGAIQINRTNVKWMKLRMTYTGTGAYGSTPAFYLTDISFYQEI